MLIVTLAGDTISDADVIGKLPGEIPWGTLCHGARAVRYDEVAGVVYVWPGGDTINVYDICGRCIDLWSYAKPPSTHIVVRDMQRRAMP